MDKSVIEKVKQSIENLKTKKSRIYFMVQDTKGYVKASVRLIYQIALILKEEGFNTIILHEKNDYTPVTKWMGNEYSDLQHKSIESGNLEISPEDFVVLPEIYGFVMEQIKNIPCGKIVFVQSYSYMLETLQPGQSWAQVGFFKCLTTTESQKNYIQSVMKQSSIDVISPIISSYFEPRKKPPMPIVAVHTKEHSDTINLIKTFYLKYPQYRWFTFRDMRGLSEQEFAETLKECFLSVWIDDQSGFGTFPIESMSCGVPVMGKIPDLNPSWMNEDNGIWFTDKVSLPDYIADFIQNWLEDSIKEEIYSKMMETAKEFKDSDKFKKNILELFNQYLDTRRESLEQQITKIEE